MTQSPQYGATPSRVLVVEDEPMIREFVCEILESEGITTVAVENADKALEYLVAQAGKIDLLLTDIRMPGSMDGAELANLVADKWASVPIVVMSGHETPSSARIKPKVVFIAKPWTISQLVDGVLAALGAASPAEPR
jgi:CheY-like chemotaxis protein